MKPKNEAKDEFFLKLQNKIIVNNIIIIIIIIIIITTTLMANKNVRNLKMNTQVKSAFHKNGLSKLECSRKFQNSRRGWLNKETNGNQSPE